MKIGIIGAGKWGQALQYAFSQNPENEVFITSRTEKEIPNFISVEELLKLEYLVFAISAQHARGWLENYFVFNNQKFLVASKGIELNSGKFLNEIFSEFMPPDNMAFISGPSFAAEVIQGLPCALVINATDPALSLQYSTFFPTFIKTYTSSDVVGAEVSGAYKNVIAIASGICEGLGLGNNARASLISRGLVEMMRFGKKFGAKKDSFIGLGGSGDLFLTASSKLSRNFRVGLALSKGKSLDDILEDLGEVAEGVPTSEAIVNIAKKEDIYVPIAREVNAIIHGKNPKESLKDLLTE